MPDDFRILSNDELADKWNTYYEEHSESGDRKVELVTDEIARRQRNGKWLKTEGWPDWSHRLGPPTTTVKTKRTSKAQIETYRHQIEASRKVCKLIAVAILDKPPTDRPLFISKSLIKRLEIALVDAGFHIHKIRREIEEATDHAG